MVTAFKAQPVLFGSSILALCMKEDKAQKSYRKKQRTNIEAMSCMRGRYRYPGQNVYRLFSNANDFVSFMSWKDK